MQPTKGTQTSPEKRVLASKVCLVHVQLQAICQAGPLLHRLRDPRRIIVEVVEIFVGMTRFQVLLKTDICRTQFCDRDLARQRTFHWGHVLALAQHLGNTTGP